MFYNTTNEKGEPLKRRRFKAQGQRNIVLKFFREHPEVGLSASEVWLNAFDPDSTPQTSIRRSITGLYKEGLINKTSETKIGLFGVPEYLWRLKK